MADSSSRARALLWEWMELAAEDEKRDRAQASGTAAWFERDENGVAVNGAGSCVDCGRRQDEPHEVSCRYV